MDRGTESKTGFFGSYWSHQPGIEKAAQGEWSEGRFYLGRRAAYPTKAPLAWLEARMIQSQGHEQ